MTRTPDAHFLVEARHQGTQVVVLSPDFSITSKVADEWIPVHQGQDPAFWLAVGHVILREFFVQRQVPAFMAYLRQYSDMPFVVALEPREDGTYRPGRLLRAADLEEHAAEEHADWKTFVFDQGRLVLPGGTIGHRWQSEKGRWNLDLTDPVTGQPIEPELLLDPQDSVAVDFPDFTSGSAASVLRHVPCRRVGDMVVTTGFELLLASYGVDRGQPGQWPQGYEDVGGTYTPAWQERLSGVSADIVLRFARQWAETAERTGGRCSIIIGAGVNHWYHNNLVYRACIVPLVLCGCVGKTGGGLNHYVGQEKLVPVASWGPIAFGSDWAGPPRLQNTPSFHYMHSDQWRYDRPFSELCPVADEGHPMTSGHTADRQVQAVRNGWLPCFPQFSEPNHEVVAEARANGASTDGAVVDRVVQRLADRKLRFSVEDPDNPESWPRLWYIWRGNAIQSSAKGHEYFLKHYLGTHSNTVAEEVAGEHVKEVTWHDKVPLGKMDLIVDLNFRMDTSALYSDILLPAATFYEKDDLSSTDLHSFIHPLQAAVRPCWEAKSDWAIFRDIAAETARLAKHHLPHPVEDVVLTPLLHDTPGEIAQPRVADWITGEVAPVPGRTMPSMNVVRRDYTQVFDRYVSLGPNVREGGLGVHGTKYPVADVYDQWCDTHPVERWGGKVYPSIRRDRDVCEVILAFAAETNGELAFRAYEAESHKTGIDHTHLAAGTRDVHFDFADLCQGPRRVLTSPFWTGITRGGRTYSAYCQNIEERIPWRTLTGRQTLYQDHEAYRAYGESLPVFKPRAERVSTHDLDVTGAEGLVLNYLTPHGKWHIHSTFADNLRMKTLSRGIEPLWLNDGDAERSGISDNDWVEVVNDHGVVVTRANVSARIPPGMCFVYHATERTIGVPKAPSRDNRRAGGHNSLTRTRLKPLFMVGGYAHLSWAFNYWGPQGVNRDTFVVVRRLQRPEW